MIGQTHTKTIDTPYRIKIELNGDGNALYIGEADPGTLSAATKGWRIKKIFYLNDEIIALSWANGTGDFNKEWDERASYTYAED